MKAKSGCALKRGGTSLYLFHYML